METWSRLVNDTDLLELLEGPPATVRASRVDEVLAQFSDSVRSGFELALGNPAWSAGAIRQVLLKAGHSVAESTIRRYRKDRFGL